MPYSIIILNLSEFLFNLLLEFYIKSVAYDD